MIINIQVDLIRPSPYQARRHFDEVKIRELGANIKEVGLINAITVRSIDDKYELLAGERRWRAVKSIPLPTIAADIKDVDDFMARKIVLSENIQREDLTPIEEIHAFADYVDMLMCEDKEYTQIHKPPIERLAWMLMKLDSDYRNETDVFTHKFMCKIEETFSSLPKPIEWRSFFNNDLKPYLKIDDEVKDVAIEKKLKKSQAKALQKVKEKAPLEFKKMKATGKAMPFEQIEENTLDELSSREIESVIKRVEPPKRVEAPMLQPILFDTNTTIFNQTSEIMDGELMDIFGNKHLIEDNSIHLVITSPPYNMDIPYDTYDDHKPWTEYEAMIKRVFDACYKKSITGGRIACVVPDVSSVADGNPPFFLAIEMYQWLKECGFSPRECLMWVKTSEGKAEEGTTALAANSTAWGSWCSPSNPCLRSRSEFILIFHKSSPQLGISAGQQTDITTDEFKAWTQNVWFIPSTSSKDHPAIFPMELAKRLVKLYSFTEQTVMDPFMGIGTTGVTAINRHFIGFDLSERYCKIAMERINENCISQQ